MDPRSSLLQASAWHRFIARIRRLPIVYQNLGLWGSCRYISKKLLAGFYRNKLVGGKIDIFAYYRFVDDAFEQTPAAAPAKTAAETAHIEPRTINWAVPGFEIGSGGHLNIFRMVWHLEQLGYQNRIIIVAGHLGTRFQYGHEARKAIREHFFPVAAEVTLGEESLAPAEFTVATSWHTAYAVRRFNATGHKIYFIQDMEAYFFPQSSDYIFAETTYRFGFNAITAGPWLAQLAQRYGMRAYPFSFSYDKNRYRPSKRRPGPRRVFFYARYVTPRRGFELGLLALNRVHQALPDVEFVLAGWDVSAYAMPFPHLNAGVLALDALPDLYAQCDVALVISLTNISLLPLELMACGCPVVSNRGPNVDWLLADGRSALLTDATPQALAQALISVLEDKTLHARLVETGLDYVKTTDWAVEAEKVHAYLDQIRNH